MPDNSLNRRVVLARRPARVPAATDFASETVPVGVLSAGRARVLIHYVSIEPAMRVWLAPQGGYLPPVGVGETMRSFAVGKIVESRVDGLAIDDIVVGQFGWQDFADITPSEVYWRVGRTRFPISYALGILRISGITAYLGVIDICRPAEGEAFAVSSAAGAVGSAAGQIARLLGARTLALAGGPSKCRLCREEYGFDVAIDYKAHAGIEALAEAVAAAFPAGIDSYFDNTAGRISDAVRRHLARGARIALCGTLSVADWNPWPQGERVERHLLNSRATMRGFVVTDHADRFAEAQEQLAAWLEAGRIVYREHVLDGLDQAPGAIAMLLEGRNEGKLVVRL